MLIFFRKKVRGWTEKSATHRTPDKASSVRRLQVYPNPFPLLCCLVVILSIYYSSLFYSKPSHKNSEIHFIDAHQTLPSTHSFISSLRTFYWSFLEEHLEGKPDVRQGYLLELRHMVDSQIIVIPVASKYFGTVELIFVSSDLKPSHTSFLLTSLTFECRWASLSNQI